MMPLSPAALWVVKIYLAKIICACLKHFQRLNKIAILFQKIEKIEEKKKTAFNKL